MCGWNLRMRMSSSMRWRSGETLGVRYSMVLPLSKAEADRVGIGAETAERVVLGGAVGRPEGRFSGRLNRPSASWSGPFSTMRAITKERGQAELACPRCRRRVLP